MNAERIFRSSRALRYFIAALCFEHPFSALYWVLQVGAIDILSTRVEPICWPFVPGCTLLRSDSQLWLWGLGLYVAFALCVGFLAIGKRLSDPVILSGLGLITAIKYGFILLDYRFGGNYHWMHLVVSAAVVLLPRKLEAARALVVLFYVLAGMLKFTPEWLSGAWADGRVSFPPQGLPMELASCFVVIMEIVLVWGLLSREARTRLRVLVILGVFHLYSIAVVGFLYPAVMAVLLLAFLFDPESLDRGEGVAIVRGEASIWTYVAVALVLLAQVPMKVYSKVPALTGEGRIPALIMFDGNVRCAMGRVARYVGRTEDLGRAPVPLAARILCDPVVVWNEARILCDRLAQDPEFDDLDIHLVSRQATDRGWTEIMRVRGFCTKRPHYQTWLPNTWMKAAAR